ncbi:FxLYD domain-containing protein [Streptomyces tauricus]|uniref:FxLYD domain-containing protein n=1 Tax=Streptomyces tauricus TaxID=68274 RepID=A0ABZ1JQD1_9ACTN|nr:FxLYD domain-containing protein [Streptomyces tauricus]MCW8096534.1 FxLYD domain-containing protein [Streptomyces tauricus]
MNTPPPQRPRGPRRPGRTRSTVVAVAALAAVASAVTSCSTDSGSDTSTPSFSERPSPPDTASFSGTAPSMKESVVESARAAASAAASSASAAASSFEASVSAEVERANKAAEKALKDVKGQGNAMSDVSMTGKPRSGTGGLLVVLVNITNKTDSEASYAVRVDFLDDSGKTVETRYVGAEDLAPGERAQPLAVSRKPAEPALTPKLSQAQRY